ncbi:MAG: glycosyltransferase family 2 protein, partial [Bdellovibrio sp.]
MALVSIVTPVYNSAATILETLRSVMAQTHSNWELHIVADEGTRDETPRIVESFQDSRIHWHRIAGRGVAKARNFGMEQSRGRWLAFLDADDIWLPEKLARQIEFMESNKALLSCHSYRRLRSHTQVVGRAQHPPLLQDYKSLLLNNRLAFFTALIDRTRLSVPSFQEHPQEDWIFWLELTRSGVKCHGLQEVLGFYRVLPSSRSARDPRLRSRWRILRDREALGFFHAV